MKSTNVGCSLALIVLIVSKIVACGIDVPNDPAQYSETTPEFAVATIRIALAQKDISVANDYLTEKGRAVVAHLISGDSHYAPPESTIIDCRMAYQNSENAWYQMTMAFDACPDNMPGGPYVFEYVMRHQNDKWKFDDILIKQFCGLKMEVEMSMIQNNLGKAEAIIIVNNPMTLGGAAVKGAAPLALDYIRKLLGK